MSFFALPSFAATPPTTLAFLTADQDSLDPWKAPNHDADLLTHLRVLNAAGGIPYFNMKTSRYQRFKLAATETNFAYPSVLPIDAFMANRETKLLQLAPGKKFLVFWHSASPVSGVMTIWESGPRFAALKLAVQGELVAIRRQTDGTLLFVFHDMTCQSEVVYNPATNVWQPAFLAQYHEMMHGSTGIPEGATAYPAAKSVRIRAAASTTFHSEPDAASAVVARTPVAAAWAIASRGDWRMLLIPATTKYDYWYNIFRGRTWMPVWAPAAIVVE